MPPAHSISKVGVALPRSSSSVRWISTSRSGARPPRRGGRLLVEALALDPDGRGHRDALRERSRWAARAAGTRPVSVGSPSGSPVVEVNRAARSQVGLRRPSRYAAAGSRRRQDDQQAGREGVEGPGVAGLRPRSRRCGRRRRARSSRGLVTQKPPARLVAGVLEPVFRQARSGWLVAEELDQLVVALGRSRNLLHAGARRHPSCAR